MKSSLSGGVFAAFCFVSLVGTAAAQYPSYSASTLSAAPQSYPAQYLPAHTQYISTSPVITAAEPLRTPAYSGYNNLTDMLGTPPAASNQPAQLGGAQQQPSGFHVHPQQVPQGRGVTPIGTSHLSCGGCGRCTDCGGCGKWFGGVYALMMRPDRANPFLFSYDRGYEAHQLTNTQNADIDWSGGFDVRLGRYFNCGRNGVEFVYWGLFPETATTWSTSDDVASGNLDAIMNWDALTYNGGTANLLVDGAEIHQLWQEQEFHNVEINLLSFCNSCGSSGSCGKCRKGGSCGKAKCGSTGLQNRCLLGVRWFKFNNGLVFAADTVDRQWTYAPEEVYYTIDVDNNLLGLQLGCEGEYCLNNCWSFDYGIKLGVYGNHVSHLSEIAGAAGTAWINNGPNTGVDFWVENAKDDVAILGEINLGAEYRFNRCWTATFGYRALGVTGVALPTNQIYADLRGIQDVRQIDSNGSLILHGGYFGAEYNF